MTLVDILWLVIIFVSALISVWRGFVREVFSLAAWILALLLAARLGGRLARMIGETIADPQVRAVTAFLLLFFVTLLVASLVGVAAYRLVHKTGLKATDRSLGLFFGTVRGVVVVGIVVLVIRATPMAEHSAYKEALLRPGVDPVANFIHRLLPEDFGQNFLSLEELKGRAREAGAEAAEKAGKEFLRKDKEGLNNLIRERTKSNE